MKRFWAILVVVLLSVWAVKSPQEAYIEKYAGLAVAEMERTGIPASVTLAQAIIESNSGLSSMAVKGNNHFGIKCHRDWRGKTMAIDDDELQECFRVYDKVEDSYRDHSDFIRYSDRYKSLFSLKPTDYRGWANGLKKAGYATDPHYASKLIRKIEEYGLDKYDVRGGTGIPVPDSPDVLDAVRPAAGFKEEYSFSMELPVYEKNGVPFVYALKGDTYESIAAANDLLAGEILRYNDVPKGTVLNQGEMVYLQTKKNKASKGLDKYIVSGEEESFHMICQRFAVRESAIRKLNRFPLDYVPHEGDTIILR